MAASAHGGSDHGDLHVNQEDDPRAGESEVSRASHGSGDHSHRYRGALRAGTARYDRAHRAGESPDRESVRTASESTRRVASRSATPVKSDDGTRSVTPTRRSREEMESGSSVTGSPSKVDVDVDDGDKRRRVVGKQSPEALFGRARASGARESSDASQDHGIAGDGLPTGETPPKRGCLDRLSSLGLRPVPVTRKSCGGRRKSPMDCSLVGRRPGLSAWGLDPRKGSLSRSLKTPHRWAHCRRGLSKCP